ncbi:BTAD domain-containing putative transcriptional regulator [Planotetraspora phitsanulokensis]|uniref:SARP family transcriptional regulator n=1 Tax=Planotetraspora phitsanulokensis TaxID=575192 RepID=A0A8J3U3A2_9ACTN|nr:BTAD domain-containing putative transcriptional regulator [Planotetraspora phitsanulokensis]GII37584.1 SARP family transcriptional regulator [Planotetraspora phitsanulokensis]
MYIFKLITAIHRAWVRIGLVQFGILGPLEVRTSAGESISVGGPRPRALLALLLLDAGRLVGVERLVDGQYGDHPPAGAANAIQAHVSRLRRNLPADLIEFHGAGYRLAVDPDDVDVHRFERLAREGRRLLTAGHHERAARSLKDALGLWRGPALADVADAPFAPSQVTRLEEVRLAAREDLVEAELALPEGTSTAELWHLVEANPLRERMRGQLMRALHAEGRQAAALAVFDEGRRLLAEELGVDPSPELAALHVAILRGEPSRGRAAGRGLPARLTSFVGREAELDRIDALRDARLVTLTGPGGSGKTRLAVEAARRRGRDVCFVDLSPLDDGGQIPQAVLSALGLRETGLRSPDPGQSDAAERVAAALADRELLLIVDNCEHVIAPAAVLVRRLLDGCPGLAVLATSREPLGLTGETLVPLPPLAVPPPGTELGEALGYGAVRLFADRAAAVRPGFEMRPEAVEICAALEGSPLAIELAAARVRSFTVEEITARLNEHGRFALLSRGDRTAAARHQTLHAVVEWSWSLLGAEEQAMARRFSVFSGGASIEAVERVCGPADVLADLVDKSLIEVSGGRYRMFDTIRLFCAERLSDAGEEERLRDAHAACFLDLAQRADPWLRRAEQLDWLARLSADHSNLEAALRHAVQAGPETALRLIAALSAYWWLSGRRGQAASSALGLLERLGRLGAGAPEPPPGLEEEYVLCVLQAVPDASPAQWARAEEIMRSLDRELRHPFAAVMWGMIAGPPEQGSARMRQFGADPWSRAMAMLGQGTMHLLDGRLAEAERELEAALGSFRSVGERWGTAQGLEWLGTISSWRGDWTRARLLWGQALDLHEQLGALDEVVDVLCQRAGGLLREGDFAAADADLRRAAEIERRTGRSHRWSLVALGRGDLARLRGEHTEARACYTESLAGVGPGTYVGDSIRLAALSGLGRLAQAEGDLEEARLRHAEVRAGAHAMPAMDLAGLAEGEAGLALLEGAAERAAFLLGVAVALRGMAVTGDWDVAGIAAGATEVIGSEAFASAFARGAALDRDGALTALS